MKDGQLKTVQDSGRPGDLLEVVWENGKMIRHQTLEDVRKRAWG